MHPELCGRSEPVQDTKLQWLETGSITGITQKEEITIVPNPTNGATSVDFSLNAAQKVSMILVDTKGNTVSTILQNKAFVAGGRTIKFTTDGLKPGLYILQMETAQGFRTGWIIVQ